LLLIWKSLSLQLPTVGLTDLRGDNTVYRTLSGESTSVDSESVEDWKNYYCMKLKVMNCVIYANETHLLFKLQNYNLAKPSRFKEIFALVEQNLNSGLLHSLHVIVESSDKLSPLVAGKYRSPRYFKNVRRLPTKYEANTNS
jgi:hypothetical protein